MTDESLSEMEGMPDCVKCGHAALDHDDEFGNCMALPNRFGMNQQDGCDCPGYAELEGEPVEPEEDPV